jgi:hypothetical protein
MAVFELHRWCKIFWLLAFDNHLRMKAVGTPFPGDDKKT